jgi:hypothetical protein
LEIADSYHHQQLTLILDFLRRCGVVMQSHCGFSAGRPQTRSYAAEVDPLAIAAVDGGRREVALSFVLGAAKQIAMVISMRARP